MFNSLLHQFQQIDKLLKKGGKILIASHQNPDADAVASVLVLHYLFKKKNLESFPYLPDPPPKNLSFLSGFFEIKTEFSFQPDLLFCLDYGDFRRLDFSAQQFLEERKIITIDHHLKSNHRGEIQIIEPKFSSTTEIIYQWLKYQNIEIDKEIAIYLLTGIISDSGGFFHHSTSAQTLKVVAELLLKGISLNKIIHQTLIFNKSLNISRAWGQILSRAKLDKETGLAYSWLNFEDFQKFGGRMIDFEELPNFISYGSFLNLGLFLIEYEKGKIKGSLRSTFPGRKDVFKIAKTLGGGGHSYAAAFLRAGTIKETLKKVLNLIK